MYTRQTLSLGALMSCLATLLGCSEPTTTLGWVSAGTLVQARSNHSATALSDGTVLFAGGTNGSNPLDSAELRSTATNHWSLAKSMQVPRTQHAGVRIRDGRILLIGGTNDGALSSVEAFDPTSRAFSTLAPMHEARIGPRAQWVKLVDPGGSSPEVKSLEYVFVTGGMGPSSALSSVEAYDPETNTWSIIKNMSVARAGHTATFIDTKTESDAGSTIESFLLVVGGADDQQVHSSADLYDVPNDTWLAIGDPMAEARRDHTATLLRDGSVLIIGGQNDQNGFLATAERYHCRRKFPASDVTCTWAAVGSLLHARRGHTATILNSGNVLVVGGENADGPLDSVEMYDIDRGEFVEMKPLSSARTQHATTWLADDSVLVVGGQSAAKALATAERFVPEDSRIACKETADCPRAMVCNAEFTCEQTAWPLDSAGACTYAGNRGPANAGVVGAAFLLLLGVWQLRRRRVATCAVTLAVAGAFLFEPSLAHAQSPTFYLDRLQIAGGSEDGTAVWRPVFGRTGLWGQLASGYARNPLRVSSFVHDPARAQALVGSAVTLQITGYATAGVEMAKRGAIQVTLPYVFQQRGYPTENRLVGLDDVVNLAPSAFGDLRFDGRMLVAWNEEHTFALAIRVTGYLPTGDESSFTGEGHAWGNWGLSGEYNAQAFGLTANAGLTMRPKSTLVDLRVGPEVTYAFGTFLPFSDDRVRIGAELWGAVGLSSAQPGAIPIEMALTSRIALGKQKQVFLGASAGGRLGFGYAPDMRFVARIGGVLPFAEIKPEPSLPVRIVPKFESDSDGDGFVDVEDQCPQQKEDFKNEKDGCPEREIKADTDKDKDGIEEAVDACPALAEDKDGIDDTDGCPEDDADSDGIADIEDKCPKDPGTRGADAAQIGCPQLIVRTKTEVRLSKQIEFEFQQATISPASYPILEEIAKLLRANPDIKQLRIEGHTDNTGSPVFNQNLSTTRAEAVRDYLVLRGKVDRKRLTSTGFGQSRPIATNETEAGRAKNRRVELHIGNSESEKEKRP